ncbi:hypothetical protein [Spirillospora sp. NPDC048819]|uniref:hypothetical protein n=1 Tax=Spirillospora sp. NPDC048819 TaxID=3155268 RepID=UPI0034098130
MPDSREADVEEAPAEALPALLVDPPWAWDPIVLDGVEPPAGPTVVSWAKGVRESFLEKAPAAPSGKDHDWDATAERIRGGRPLADLTAKGRSTLYARLLVHGPDDLAAEALDDRRYWGDLVPNHVRAVVARHELAAYRLALHAVRPDDPDTLGALAPFLDADVARLVIVHSDGARRLPVVGWPADAWFDGHGTAALPYVLPYALGEPGRDRAVAEAAIRGIIADHGHDAVAEAAARHGGEAVRAVQVLRYPLARHGPQFPLDGLPSVLLRDGRHVLPAASVRHLVTLLSWLRPERPRPALGEVVEEVVEACDPGSLADFAWGLYRAEFDSRTPAERRGVWASDGVRYALERFGDDRTAARLAAVVARWSSREVRPAYAQRASALRVFTALGSDAALRLLDGLGREAADQTRIGPGALEAMREIAERRGLSGQRLAARLVPDFGLDAEGGMNLDYGPRGFRVGFDERLRPHVVDADDERHASPPEPGPASEILADLTELTEPTELAEVAEPTTERDRAK